MGEKKNLFLHNAYYTFFSNNTQDFFAFALQKANLRVKMVQEKNITKKQKQSKTKLENME